MFIKATNIMGLSVYSLKDGRKIETVSDVIYDPRENKIEALLIDKGGWFSEAKVIMFEDIKGVGEDAVIVESESVVKKAEDVKKEVASIAKDGKELTGSRIITENGKDLGAVSDLLVDPKTGQVEEFEVSQGTFQNLSGGKKRVKISDIITIGEDATIVKGYAKDMFEEQEKEQGLKGAITKGRDTLSERATRMQEDAPGILNDLTDKFKEIWQQTREELDQLTRQAQTKGEELRSHPKTQETISKAKQKAMDAKKAAESRIVDYKTKLLENRKKRVVGMILAKAIVNEKDEVVANAGDLITHKLLDKAEEEGVLEEVLDCAMPQVNEIRK